jgi:DNA replication protein DnaC
MNNHVPIWKKIPSHITPKTVVEMALIRQQASIVVNEALPKPAGKTTGIGTRFQHSSFDNYLTRTEVQADAVSSLKNWITWVELGYDTNLILAGYRGTGKTHLAVAAMKSLSQHGLSSEIVPFHEMMLEIRSTYRASSAQSERDVFLRLSQCDLLVLDDIDKSHYSINEHQALQTLINQRYRNQKPTTFITPLPSQRFCSALGDVPLDRLHQGHLLWIECTWPNFRESG